jgi:hypothetical protein
LSNILLKKITGIEQKRISSRGNDKATRCTGYTNPVESGIIWQDNFFISAAILLLKGQQDL